MQYASIIITTKNRKSELRAALQSVFEQNVQLEVIVVDDGSTDGTSAMVSEDYPKARLIRHEASIGLVGSRNEAAEAATAEYLFSIDDDAVFTDPATVQNALEAFQDPQVGAIALPYINVNESDKVLSARPSDEEEYAFFTFTGTAHAHRRSVFLELGGYRSFLRHWGEERDYCIRLYEAGYYVKACPVPPIHHFVSPKRNRIFDNTFLYRNQVLFPFLNAPLRFAFPMILRALAWNVWNVLRNPGFVRAYFPAHWKLVRDLFLFCRERKPVSQETFRLAMELHQKGGLPVRLVKPRLNAGVKLV